jgi:hypothetical protein
MEKAVEIIEDLLLRYSSDYNIEIDAKRCFLNKDNGFYTK